MFTAKVEISFCAGHRLLLHKGKCNYYHGHNYLATIGIGSFDLDANDMVMDFADIKNPIKKWIDENWDHNMILNPNDPMLKHNLQVQPNRSFYAMPHKNQAYEPTAENMAKVLYDVVDEILEIDRGEFSLQISIRETPNCSVSYFE